MKKFFIFLFISTFFLISADTIWQDSFMDVYGRRVGFKVNDSIKVIIDEKSLFDYTSSVKSLKSVTFDVTSKEITGVFELVPSGTVEENKNSKEKDQFKYSGEIQARIVSVTDNSIAIVGVKTVTINNKTTRVELRGDVALRDIKGNKISSADIINSSLVITTLLENDSAIISIDELNANTSIETTIDEEGNAVDTILPDGTYSISEEKKKELLLEYLNKALNVVF